MKPGRDLDKLVGEKIFGYEVVTHSSVGRDDLWYKKNMALILLPHYSTMIASAWLVAKEGTEKFGSLELLVKRNETLACFADAEKQMETSMVQGVTAAHAICLAALKAVKT